MGLIMNEKFLKYCPPNPYNELGCIRLAESLLGLEPVEFPRYVGNSLPRVFGVHRK